MCGVCVQVDYTVTTLLEWVDTVKDLDVHFAGFSNPKVPPSRPPPASPPSFVALPHAFPQPLSPLSKKPFFCHVLVGAHA